MDEASRTASRDRARRLRDADAALDDRVPRHRAARPRPGRRRRSGTSHRATRARLTRPHPAFTGTETDPTPGAGVVGARGGRPRARGRASTSRCSSQDAIRVAYCQPPSARTSTSTSTTSATSPAGSPACSGPTAQPKAAYQALRNVRPARSTARSIDCALVRRRHPAAAGRGDEAGAAAAPDHGPARELGRRLRRDGHLARPPARERAGLVRRSSTSASRRCGRRSGSAATARPPR